MVIQSGDRYRDWAGRLEQPTPLLGSGGRFEIYSVVAISESNNAYVLHTIFNFGIHISQQPEVKGEKVHYTFKSFFLHFCKISEWTTTYYT